MYSLLVLVPFVLSVSELRNKKYWFILIAVLIPFAIVTKIFGIYEDKNLLVLNEELRLEKLSPIHTNSERAGYLEQVDTIVKNLKSKGVKVYFYGDKAHIFHYLYPETSFEIISFFQPVDKPDFFEELKKKIDGNSKVAVFLISSYPEVSDLTGSLIEQKLSKTGFQLVKALELNYYIK
jgi:hypothetical protein